MTAKQMARIAREIERLVALLDLLEEQRRKPVYERVETCC